MSDKEYEVIALSEDYLSTVHYHWFWGLYRDESKPSQLWSDVQALKTDESKREATLSAVKSVWGTSWLNRAFHRAFNINNYWYQSDLVQCYLSLELYEALESQLASTEGSNKVKVFKVTTDAAAAVASEAWNYFSESNRGSLLEQLSGFGRRLLTLFGINISTLPMLTDVGQSRAGRINLAERAAALEQQIAETEQARDALEQAPVSINDEMLPNLEVLGLPGQAGDTFLLTDAKKAYRKLALRAHPDKGGTEATFQALTKAYETLLEQAEQASPQSKALIARYRYELSGYQGRLETIQAFQRTEAVAQAYMARVDAVLEKRKEQQEHQERQQQEQERQLDQQKRQQQDLEQIEQGIERHQEDLDAFKQKSDIHRQNLDEIEQHSEANAQGLEEVETAQYKAWLLLEATFRAKGMAPPPRPPALAARFAADDKEPADVDDAVAEEAADGDTTYNRHRLHQPADDEPAAGKDQPDSEPTDPAAPVK